MSAETNGEKHVATEQPDDQTPQPQQDNLALNSIETPSTPPESKPPVQRVRSILKKPDAAPVSQLQSSISWRDIHGRGTLQDVHEFEPS